MKQKCTLFGLALMVFLIPFNGQAQSVSFTTSSFSTVNAIPVGYQYQYTYSQSMYMSYLFNIAEGNITKIMYYWNGGIAGTNNNLTNSNVWTVYMGHRPDTTIAASATWLPLDSLTEVFSDTIELTAPGWVGIELTTPYPYNAARGNLVIAVDENAPGAAYPSAITSTGFRSGSIWLSSNNKTIYRASNTVNIDPSVPGSSISRTQFVNHITMNIEPPNSLPITLKEFRAVNAGSHNLLHWESATEGPDDTYIIERGHDGKIFTEISRMDADKNADGVYDFTDKAPFAGTSYYRLRLRSKEGKVSFSRVVNATVKQGGFQAKLYPNPAKDKVVLAVTGSSGKAMLQICDVLGHPIKSLSPDPTGNTTINLELLPSGSYFLKYKDETHLETLKFIKD